MSAETRYGYRLFRHGLCLADDHRPAPDVAGITCLTSSEKSDPDGSVPRRAVCATSSIS